MEFNITVFYKKLWCYYIKGKRTTCKLNDELEVGETLNSHYINIVKTTCGQPTQAKGYPKNQANDIASVNAITSNCRHNPSINQIRKNALILKYIVFLKQKKKK